MTVFIIQLLLLALLLTIAFAAKSLAPWVPAWSKDLKRIARLADMKPDEVFYEVGCGDGRVCDHIQKRFGVKAIGIELAFPLYLVCLVRKLKNRKLIFKCRDLFGVDLSKADVLYFFALPNSIERLKDKLKKELKPGARVISYTFPLPGWTPITIDKQEGETDIYLYQI